VLEKKKKIIEMLQQKENFKSYFENHFIVDFIVVDDSQAVENIKTHFTRI
jgi:hypothetical protein